MARKKKPESTPAPAATPVEVAVAELEAEKEQAVIEPQAASPIIDTVETRRNLRCFLTDQEKSDASETMAQAVLHMTDLNEQKKAAGAQFTNQIKEANATVQRCATLLNNGHEFREVQCRTTKDYTSGRITIVRLDTGEAIEDRPMNDVERQIPLRLRPPEPTEKWVSGEEAVGAAEDSDAGAADPEPEPAPPLQLVPEPKSQADEGDVDGEEQDDQNGDETPWDEDKDDDDDPDDDGDEDDWLDGDDDDDDDQDEDEDDE